VSSNSMLSIVAFFSPPMSAWSSADSRRAQSGCSDPVIVVDQEDFPAPFVCNEFGGGGSQNYYNNQRNPQ